MKSTPKSTRVLYLIAATFLAVGLGIQWRRGLHTAVSNDKDALREPASRPAEPAESSQQDGRWHERSASQGAAPARLPAGEASADWHRLSSSLGTHLVPQFDRAGRLIAVQGTAGQGGRAANGFDSSRSDSVIARAREIMNEAAPLLGAPAPAALDEMLVTPGRQSAQVFFPQHHAGLALVPTAGVTLDLGSQGELIGLQSNIVPPVAVTNRSAVSSEEAKLRALAAIPGAQLGQVEGGRKVIWLASRAPASGEQAIPGRVAYEYSASGHQIWIDAENGNVLLKRDRRQF